MRLPLIRRSSAPPQSTSRPGGHSLDSGRSNNGALVQQESNESDDGATLADVPDGEFTIRTRLHHLQGIWWRVVFDVSVENRERMARRSSRLFG